MERAFDSQLDDLKNLILTMGGHVEKALSVATAALLNRNFEMFQEVHQIEHTINSEHISVDENCTALLAKQGPVAKDLRLIVSILKINTDLERMGDQCVNISHTGKDYLKRNSIANLSDIARMSEIAREMVKASLDSFVRADVFMAKSILSMDDELDQLKNKVFRDVCELMKKSPNDVEAGLDLILIARNLERMGDHSTNIAEDVIYAVTGRDIRHGGKHG